MEYVMGFKWTINKLPHGRTRQNLSGHFYLEHLINIANIDNSSFEYGRMIGPQTLHNYAYFSRPWSYNISYNVWRWGLRVIIGSINRYYRYTVMGAN